MKLKYIKDNTDYEIVDNKYIIAYKSVRENMRSVYKPSMKYEVGKTYESKCNYNINQQNSFGLSGWTKQGAIDYYSIGKLLKVVTTGSK